MQTSKQTSEKVLDQYYLEVRCKLLDIAAILDRYDRAGGDSTQWKTATDPRIVLCRQAIDIINDTQPTPNRAEQIALLFSDPAE